MGIIIPCDPKITSVFDLFACLESKETAFALGTMGSIDGFNTMHTRKLSAQPSSFSVLWERNSGEDKLLLSSGYLPDLGS
jgi:hypothetical protein